MKYIKTYEMTSQEHSDLQKEINRRKKYLQDILVKYMKVFYVSGKVIRTTYMLDDDNYINVRSENKKLNIVSYGLDEAIILLIEYLKSEGFIKQKINDLYNKDITLGVKSNTLFGFEKSDVWYDFFNTLAITRTLSNANTNRCYRIWVRPEILTDVVNAIEKLITTDDVQAHGQIVKYNL
jgi:hypothetical protein